MHVVPQSLTWCCIQPKTLVHEIKQNLLSPFLLKLSHYEIALLSENERENYGKTIVHIVVCMPIFAQDWKVWCRIMAPKRAHPLILRTCAYVTLWDKGDFADVVKDIEKERSSWIIWVVPCNHISP